MVERPPVEDDVARRDVDLLEPAGHDPALLPGPPEVRKVRLHRPVGGGQRRLAAGQHVELVHVEGVEVVGHGHHVLELVARVEHHPAALAVALVVVRVLHDERQMRPVVDVRDRLEVERVAVLEQARAGPDERLQALAPLRTLCTADRSSAQNE